MDRKERKELFIDLGNLIDKSGETYYSFLLDPKNPDYHPKLVEYERSGDVIETTLNEYYTNQRNIPYLSLDRARLLAKLDEILDSILLASKTIDAFGGSLPDDFNDMVKQTGKDVKEMLKLVKTAIIELYEDFQSASATCIKIEELRDELSREVFQIEKHYFQNEPTGENWKIFTAVSRILRRTNSIINSAKAASEMIQLMTMKYL